MKRLRLSFLRMMKGFCFCVEHLADKNISSGWKGWKMDKFQVFLWCIVCVFVMEGTACYHSNTKRAAIARQDKIGVLLIIITQNRSVNNEIRANPTRCIPSDHCSEITDQDVGLLFMPIYGDP